VRLDKLWIAAHVPQRGAMCLLEEVLEWDAAGVLCRTESHRAVDNPLRAHGRLGVACGIEYAAQAMAIHGALLAPERATPQNPGLLASTRAVAFHVERLDDIAGSLLARATYVHGDASMVLYDFTVSDAARVLLAGRTAIAFAGAGRTEG
jgi:predicted hotdog family 3-hydroxylacyl-ACP dehydratase